MSNRISFIKTLAVIITVGGLSVGCGPNIEKITKQAEADAKASFETEKAEITSQKDQIQGELDDTNTQLDEKKSKLSELQGKLANMFGAETTDSGLKFTLGSGFKSGTATLVNKAMPKLEKLAKYIQQTNNKLLIVGHTDNKGDEEKNQELSEQRANAVSDFLTNLGVAEDRIETQGAGSTEPVADNETAEGREQNRRVEITILN